MSIVRFAADLRGMKRGEKLLILLGGTGSLYVLAILILDATGLPTPLSAGLESTSLPQVALVLWWLCIPAVIVFIVVEVFAVARTGRLRSALGADPYYLVRDREYADFALSDEEFGVLCEAMSRLSAAASATSLAYRQVLGQYVRHLDRHWLSSPGAVQLTRVLTVMVEQELWRYKGHETRTKAKEGRT